MYWFGVQFVSLMLTFSLGTLPTCKTVDNVARFTLPALCLQFTLDALCFLLARINKTAV